LTDAVNKEFVVRFRNNVITSIDKQKLPRVHKRLGINTTISEPKEQ